MGFFSSDTSNTFSPSGTYYTDPEAHQQISLNPFADRPSGAAVENYNQPESGLSKLGSMGMKLAGTAIGGAVAGPAGAQVGGSVGGAVADTGQQQAQGAAGGPGGGALGMWKGGYVPPSKRNFISGRHNKGVPQNVLPHYGRGGRIRKILMERGINASDPKVMNLINIIKSSYGRQLSNNELQEIADRVQQGYLTHYGEAAPQLQQDDPQRGDPDFAYQMEENPDSDIDPSETQLEEWRQNAQNLEQINQQMRQRRNVVNQPPRQPIKKPSEQELMGEKAYGQYQDQQQNPFSPAARKAISMGGLGLAGGSLGAGIGAGIGHATGLGAGWGALGGGLLGAGGGALAGHLLTRKKQPQSIPYEPRGQKEEPGDFAYEEYRAPLEQEQEEPGTPLAQREHAFGEVYGPHVYAPNMAGGQQQQEASGGTPGDLGYGQQQQEQSPETFPLSYGANYGAKPFKTGGPIPHYRWGGKVSLEEAQPFLTAYNLDPDDPGVEDFINTHEGLFRASLKRPEAMEEFAKRVRNYSSNIKGSNPKQFFFDPSLSFEEDNPPVSRKDLENRELPDWDNDQEMQELLHELRGYDPEQEREDKIRKALSMGGLGLAGGGIGAGIGHAVGGQWGALAGGLLGAGGGALAGHLLTRKKQPQQPPQRSAPLNELQRQKYEDEGQEMQNLSRGTYVAPERERELSDSPFVESHMTPGIEGYSEPERQAHIAENQYYEQRQRNPYEGRYGNVSGSGENEPNPQQEFAKLSPEEQEQRGGFKRGGMIPKGALGHYHEGTWIDELKPLLEANGININNPDIQSYLEKEQEQGPSTVFSDEQRKKYLSDLADKLHTKFGPPLKMDFDQPSLFENPERDTARYGADPFQEHSGNIQEINERKYLMDPQGNGRDITGYSPERIAEIQRNPSHYYQNPSLLQRGVRTVGKEFKDVGRSFGTPAQRRLGVMSGLGLAGGGIGAGIGHAVGGGWGALAGGLLGAGGGALAGHLLTRERKVPTEQGTGSDSGYYAPNPTYGLDYDYGSGEDFEPALKGENVRGGSVMLKKQPLRKQMGKGRDFQPNVVPPREESIEEAFQRQQQMRERRKSAPSMSQSYERLPGEMIEENISEKNDIPPLSGEQQPLPAGQEFVGQEMPQNPSTSFLKDGGPIPHYWGGGGIVPALMGGALGYYGAKNIKKEDGTPYINPKLAAGLGAAAGGFGGLPTVGALGGGALGAHLTKKYRKDSDNWDIAAGAGLGALGGAGLGTGANMLLNKAGPRNWNPSSHLVVGRNPVERALRSNVIPMAQLYTQKQAKHQMKGEGAMAVPHLSPEDALYEKIKHLPAEERAEMMERAKQPEIMAQIGNRPEEYFSRKENQIGRLKELQFERNLGHLPLADQEAVYEYLMDVSPDEQRKARDMNAVQLSVLAKRHKERQRHANMNNPLQEFARARQARRGSVAGIGRQ